MSPGSLSVRHWNSQLPQLSLSGLVLWIVQAVLGVIVPAFNEVATLSRVIECVLKQPCVAQVVIVDDGSTDGGFERSYGLVGDGSRRDRRVTFLRHEANRGKGAAIRTGLDAIRTPIVLIQDADLEYEPSQYAELIAPIEEGDAEVVFGVRGFMGQTAYSYWFVVGNRLVTWATNILFNCYIHDMETGYKVMRTDLMRRLDLKGDRFDIEPEITARVLRLGYRIHEVPISYRARSRAEGKKLTWRDGVLALMTLVRIRFTPMSLLFNIRPAAEVPEEKAA